MATTTFTGTDNWSNAGSWDNGIPTASDDAIISGTCNMDQDGDALSLIVSAGANLDINTFDLDVVGATSVAGALITGASSNTGLTTGTLSFINTATFDINADFKINVDGDFSIANASIWVAKNRGLVTLTGSGDYSNPNNQNVFKTFKQNAGVTTTVVTDASNTVTNSGVSSVWDGTLNVGAFGFTLGGATLTFGTGFDLIGSSRVLMSFNATSATWIANNTNPLSFTGQYRCNTSITSLTLPALNSPYAELELRPGATNTHTYTIAAGTMTVDKFTIFNTGTGNVVIDNSVNSPTIRIYGAIELFGGTGPYTVTWDPTEVHLLGTGTGLDNVDTNNINLGNVTLNTGSSSRGKNFRENFQCNDLTVISGYIVNALTLTINGNYETSIATGGFSSGGGGDVKLAGSSKTITANITCDIQRDFEIATGASYTFNGGFNFECNVLNVVGTVTYNGGTIIAHTFDGAGTMTFPAPTKYVYYRTTNNFSGTLTNVIIVEYVGNTGLSNLRLKIGLEIII